MGSWIQYTFFVEHPQDVAASLRSRLTVLDRVWVTKATQKPEGSVPVVTLRSPRFSSVSTDDRIRLLEIALEPADTAAMVAASNTTDSGDATIFTKSPKRNIRKIGSAHGKGGDRGYLMQKEAWKLAGIAPIYFKDPMPRERAADPYWYHRDLFELECRYYTGGIVARRESGPCPHCGGAIEYAKDTGRFRWQYRCLSSDTLAHSRDGFTTTQVYNPDRFPDPEQQCSCGGDFRKQDLGYPALTSTVYECSECGTFTSDFPAHDHETFAPVSFRDAPGKSVTERMYSWLDPDMIVSTSEQTQASQAEERTAEPTDDTAKDGSTESSND